MSDKKISQLTTASLPLAGTEPFPIVQSGATVKVTPSQLFTSPPPIGNTTRNSGAFTTLTSNTTATAASAVSCIGVDLNTLVVNGSYMGYATSNNPISTGDWIFVQVNTNGSDITEQVCTLAGYLGGATYKRFSNNLGSTWTNWVQFAELNTSGNLAFPSGQGIDFSATAGTGTSELLADYEEGTFTPSVAGSTTAGTATYGRQTGVYTKVGRLVTFSIDLAWGSGTGTGDLIFTGLPYTSNATGNTGINSSFVILSLTASNYLNCWMTANSTTILAYQSPVGGGNISAVAYNGSGSVMLFGSYIV